MYGVCWRRFPPTPPFLPGLSNGCSMFQKSFQRNDKMIIAEYALECRQRSRRVLAAVLPLRLRRNSKRKRMPHLDAADVPDQGRTRAWKSACRSSCPAAVAALAAATGRPVDVGCSSHFAFPSVLPRSECAIAPGRRTLNSFPSSGLPRIGPGATVHRICLSTWGRWCVVKHALWQVLVLSGRR